MKVFFLGENNLSFILYILYQNFDNFTNFNNTRENSFCWRQARGSRPPAFNRFNVESVCRWKVRIDVEVWLVVKKKKEKRKRANRYFVCGRPWNFLIILFKISLMNKPSRTIILLRNKELCKKERKWADFIAFCSFLSQKT